MGRILHGAVILLFLQCGHLFASESSITQLEYSYRGDIVARTFAKAEVISQWSLLGKLLVQIYEDKAVIKFADLKTTAFNGLESDFAKQTKFLDISDEALILQEPFIIHYDDGKIKSISHLPDEPLWSINIKRAIGSILQFDFDTYSDPSVNLTEWNIYGKCNINYEIEQSADADIVNKIINECEEEPLSNWNNLLPVPISPEGHKVPSIDVVRKYSFTKNAPKRPDSVQRIESLANVTYKTMPVDDRAHYINQKQVFELLSNKLTDQLFDFTKNTGLKNITYEYSHVTPTAEEQNATKLIEEFDKYYTQFQNHFNSDHLSKFDIHANDTIDQMFNLFSRMSNDMLDFSSLLIFLSDDSQVANVFMSLIPYVGTEQTVRFLKEIIEADALNDLTAIKVLATFPTYLNSPDEKILQKLEVLLDLNKVVNKHVRYTGILSFATLVADTYNRDGCTKKTFKKYVKKFHTLYTDTEDYELRMIYMLGLSNMGLGLNADFILPILSDSKEHPQIRSLATYAFKRELTSEPEEVFSTMWPVVTNRSEPFECRVAALDLLLASELTEDQYYTILRAFSKYPSKQREQHLHQYFYTSILSLQETTRYSDNLGSLATSTFSKIEMPRSYKTLSTGNYRVSYTDADANFGGYFETRLVADPNTNFINTVQFTVNRFAMTLNLGTYSIYLKLEGIPDLLLEKILIYGRDEEEAIPKLLELIRKNNYKFKEYTNMHIDMVLFCDNRVLYAMHFDLEDIGTQLAADTLKYFMSHESITFPVLDHTYIPSDLGTQISTKNEETQFYSQNIKNLQYLFDDDDIMDYELKVRSSWESYIQLYSENPLINLTIGTYDVKVSDQLLIFPFVGNGTGPFLKWQNENVTLNLEAAITTGTLADEEDVLKQYCSDCVSTYDLSEKSSEEDKEIPLEIVGLSLKWNCAHTGYSSFPYKKIIKSHKQNYYAFPPARIFLLLLHIYDYLLYLPPAETWSLSVKSTPLYSEPSESYIELGITGDSLQENNDPFDGLELGAYVAFTNKRIKDEFILRHWNLSSYMEFVPESTDKHIIARNFGAQIDNTFEDGQKIKFCVHRKVFYPGKRSDKYSLNPAQPAEAKVTVAMGSDICAPENTIIDISGLISITDEQQAYVKNLPEYKTCKKQAVGLKYIPPTKECVKVSHILSNYRQYDIGMIWNMTKYLPSNSLEDDEYSLKHELFGSSNMFERGLNFSMTYDIKEPKVIMKVNGKTSTENYRMRQYFNEFLLIDTTVIAYNDEDIVLGLSSNCFITPNNIRTFTEDTISNYDNKVNENYVAFVECVNTSRSGLVFSRLSDKHVAFKFWENDNILAATTSNDKLKVVLNGEIQQTDINQENSTLNVYFLDTDVIYVTSPLLEIYYNTEYIILKIFSNYNNYICGLCGYQQ